MPQRRSARDPPSGRGGLKDVGASMFQQRLHVQRRPQRILRASTSRPMAQSVDEPVPWATRGERRTGSTCLMEGLEQFVRHDALDIAACHAERRPPDTRTRPQRSEGVRVRNSRIHRPRRRSDRPPTSHLPTQLTQQVQINRPGGVRVQTLQREGVARRAADYEQFNVDHREATLGHAVSARRRRDPNLDDLAVWRRHAQESRPSRWRGGEPDLEVGAVAVAMGATALCSIVGAHVVANRPPP